jgi:hypothetical protein
MRLASWLDASMKVWLEAATPGSIRGHATARVASWMVAAVHAWLRGASGAALRGIALAARHAGIPAVVVAAIALLLAFRIARRAMHLLVEVALVLALFLVATKAGWLRF